MAGPATATADPVEAAAGTAPSAFDVVASTAALFALAVAQPLLSLLGGSPEFFVARDSPISDIVGLALLLTVVVPLLLGAAIVVVVRLHRGAGVVLHGSVLALLGAVLAVQVMGNTPLGSLPGVVQIAAGLAAGAALAMFYRRSPTFRSVMRWGILAPVLVLGSFLVASPTSDLIFASAPPPAATVAVDDPAPVVFLILDEFPVSSLMDAAGNLQEDLYPNFARLAEDGTWYRNAVTVHHMTQFASPAILTGLEPEGDELPTLADYPDNLFTLLAGTYDIDSTEIVTRLCPDTCRSHDVAAPVRMRWRALADDLAVVAGHVFLPEDMASGLPSIDSGWGNFAAGAEGGEMGSGAFDEWFSGTVRADRRQPVEAFLERLDDETGRPTLHFMHALLPHSPWTYLPSGQRLEVPDRSPARAQTGWVEDEWLVDQAYQLHLLQVQYADTVVGDVIERLEEMGTYDDTLLVVVADHGIVVRPGPLRRAATEDNLGEIPPVPLFIKAPHQDAGGVDDYRVHTTDIVPTVADILGIDLPWEPDGTSLVAAERPERSGSAIMGDAGPIQFGADWEGARLRAAAKVARFGDEGPFGLAPQGYADLLGQPLGSLPVGDAASIRARVETPADLDDVDTSAAVLPAYVQGRLEGAEGPAIIAVAVNGEIVAVTRSYTNRRGVDRFDAVIPPESLVDGANDLRLVLVAGEGENRLLHPAATT